MDSSRGLGPIGFVSREHDQRDHRRHKHQGVCLIPPGVDTWDHGGGGSSGAN